MSDVPRLNELDYEQTEAELEIEREHRQDYIQGLRDLADWLEDTPSATVPVYQSVYVYLSSKEHAVQLAKEAGSIRKNYEDSRLVLEKRFGHTIRYKANVTRDKVCTIKEVKQVEKEVAHYPQPIYVKQVVEEIEWECDPLLAPTESEG